MKLKAVGDTMECSHITRLSMNLRKVKIMIMKLKKISCLLTIGIILVSSMSVYNSSCGQEQGESFKWNIETNKNEFYPGEPVLLTLNISNAGVQKEEVDFGMDGIEAFSMEIRDSNDNILEKGNKIERFGFTVRSPVLDVPPGKIGQKSVVLNQWCSTLLSPGKYQVICNIDYRLESESKKIEGSDNGFKAGPIHTLKLKLDIQIIAMDAEKLKKILEALAAFEVKPKEQSKKEWLEKRETAREMLAFTESALAVPYQLQILRNDPYTWFCPDVVNSLVKSGTLEAAIGLVQIIEDPSRYKEDVKPILIEGVYKFRDTGKSEIINVTKEFVTKYQRPMSGLGRPAD